MPRIPGTTNAQTRFLRAFHTHPAGPPPADWPSPAVLRKWMRKPRFRQALQSLRDTLRFEADVQLAAAASLATHALNTTLATPGASDASDSETRAKSTDLSVGSTPDRANDLRTHVHALTHVLRLSHTRQRFAPPDPAPPAPPTPETPKESDSSITLSMLRALRGFHPNADIKTCLSLLRRAWPEPFELMDRQDAEGDPDELRGNYLANDTRPEPDPDDA